MRVLLAKLNQTGHVTAIVHGEYESSQSIVIRKHLQKGNYLVFVEVDWMQKFYKEVNLTTYSAVKIDMQEEPLSRFNISLLYQAMIKTYMLISGDSQIKTKRYFYHGEKLQLHEYRLDKFGVVAILYSDREKDVTLHNRLDLKLSNMELYMPKSSHASEIEVTVPPGKDRIIMFQAKVFKNKNTAYAYGYSEIYQMTNNYTKQQLIQLCKQKVRRLKV